MSGMLKCPSLNFLQYYYDDYTTDSPAEDVDSTLDDWLYELMDVAGK